MPSRTRRWRCTLENDLAAAVQRGFGRIDLRKNILARELLVHHAVNGLHLTDDDLLSRQCRLSNHTLFSSFDLHTCWGITLYTPAPRFCQYALLCRFCGAFGEKRCCRAKKCDSDAPGAGFSDRRRDLYDRDEMARIYRTGRGSVKVRARWRHLQKENIIEIYEIPYSTTVEAVIDKVAELAKAGKLREVADMRDETDLSGLKLAIDLKRGADPEQVMQKLFRLTPLCDSFACNFNILIAGNPRVMGVGEILDEWIAWRMECIRRRVFFDLQKKRAKLHLLQGLGKILLDIDRAIAIIRNTEREADVVPNLMAGFDLDEVQANFVAEIKLRNINREYILKRTAETDALEKDIADLEATLESKRRIRGIIIRELKEIIRRYPSPRRTGIVAAESVAQMPDDCTAA